MPAAKRPRTRRRTPREACVVAWFPPSFPAMLSRTREPHRRGDHGLGLVAVRRVPAARELDALRKSRGEEERDRAAVAVAVEPGRLVHAERVEQRRQHLVRLAMHEVRLPALLGLARRRSAVARARIDETAHAERGAELRREIA